MLDIQFVSVSSIDPSTGMPPTSASATVSFESPESAVKAVAVLDGSPATADQSHMLRYVFSLSFTVSVLFFLCLCLLSLSFDFSMSLFLS